MFSVNEVAVKSLFFHSSQTPQERDPCLFINHPSWGTTKKIGPNRAYLAPEEHVPLRKNDGKALPPAF